MQIINNIAYIEAKSGNIDEAIKILRRHISNNRDIDVIYKIQFWLFLLHFK